MASDEKKIMGAVRTQDLSVSWISESGMCEENTDRICILTMANGQVRLTMQSASMNLKGIRLTKGHVCVFALFEPVSFDNADAEAADKASEVFMNNIMTYDITKKPAEGVIKKCLSKAEKTVSKEFKNVNYKASVAAFAGKELTVCSVRGGRMFILREDGKMLNILSPDGIGITGTGTAWKNVMMVSEGYCVTDDEVRADMMSPAGDLITKRAMCSGPRPSSFIRAQKI